MVDEFYEQWTGDDVTEYKDWSQKDKDAYNKRATEEKRLDVEIPKSVKSLNKLNDEAKEYRKKQECD